METKIRRPQLNSQARSMLRKLILYCEDEADKNQLRIPLSQASSRVAAITGVSERMVTQMKLNLKDPSDKECPPSPKQRYKVRHINVFLENTEKSLIKNIIYEFYVTKRSKLSLNEVLLVVKENVYFPWKKNELLQLLSEIGYCYRSCGGGRPILREKLDSVAARCNFLMEIQKYRDMNRSIVYLGDTCIDFNIMLMRKKRMEFCNLKSSPFNLGGQLIVFLAAGTNGFDKETLFFYHPKYHNWNHQKLINHEVFESWLRDKLLPCIPQNSVICFNDAFYTRKKTDDIPSKYSTKNTMVQWLESQGIKVDSSLRKPDLIQLINDKKPNVYSYSVDELIKLNGHEVIRIPPYHWDLNPIELAWFDLKYNIQQKIEPDFPNKYRLKELTIAELQNIYRNDWSKYCEHVKKTEDFYREHDALVDDIVDSIINTTQNDSESEVSSFEENDYEKVIS